MEQTLLSKTQAAEILGYSISTLDKLVREKKLIPVKGHKTPRFNLYDVHELAGTDMSKLSPFERKKLEREKAELEQRITELEEENRIIKSKITNSVADLSQILREA